MFYKNRTVKLVLAVLKEYYNSRFLNQKF